MYRLKALAQVSFDEQDTTTLPWFFSPQLKVDPTKIGQSYAIAVIKQSFRMPSHTPKRSPTTDQAWDHFRRATPVRVDLHR